MQNGQCAICKDSGDGGHGIILKLYVDHSHLTGVVRGLLCYACNSAIGFLKEDPLVLENAQEYLRKHK